MAEYDEVYGRVRATMECATGVDLDEHARAVASVVVTARQAARDRAALISEHDVGRLLRDLHPQLPLEAAHGLA
jgi:hypothetical protein